MFVVAIAELKGAIDDEAAALAADLRVTAYEARLLLAPGTPAVVKTTADEAQALDLLARVRARGQGAVACDASAVVPSSAMVSMRRLRLAADAVTLDDRPGERLPYDDVLALVAAVHRRRAATSGEVRESKLSVTRAVVTSGLSMTKTVRKDTHAVAEERAAVLYVFRKSGATPWLLHEHGTAWTGHGGPVAPSQGENFRYAVGALRAAATRAGAAVFDDRLVARKAAPERVAVATGSGASGASSASGTFGATGATGGRRVTLHTSSEGGVDLLAHLLALWIARTRV